MAEKKSAKETNGKDSTKETKTRTAKTKADSRAKTEPKAKKEPTAKMTAKPAAKPKQRTKSRAKAKPKMNLKVIALGGLDEIGKNMTVLEYGDDIIIIDAEREYGDLVRALRGIVLEISPNSRHHINPLEIARGYGMGENPVALKSELLMSICEQQMGEGQLGAFHKSIIDRCTASVYHDFIKSGGKARQPILSDWRNEIKRQPEREAQELALASELFVEGSLNMFAHETNVDIDSRIIVFDLYEMGDQLKPTALNVTMETIQNRVATNRLAGKYTWVFVDEVYVRPEAA